MQTPKVGFLATVLMWTTSMASAFPALPFTTSGSSILGVDGANIAYAGVNWPGATEPMVPEGLQYQSISTIVSKIKELGMNVIRLTYATELVDQIFDHEMVDIPIMTAFNNALGMENGTTVFKQVLENNPSFNENTTRLQVYDAIAAECAQQQIYVHLDNHVSKASWCCGVIDGNGWWGDNFFSPTNWTRGLSFMADHGKSWSNLASMSLYNELRPPLAADGAVISNYTWAVWYEQVQRGADAIHNANSDVLIFLSGLDGDMNLQPVVNGNPLPPGNTTFDRSAFAPYQDKLVLELHSYDIITPVTDCPTYNADLFAAGYSAVNSSTTRFPVVMTEWGFTQDDTTWRQGTYAQCVQEFLHAVVPSSGWIIWELGGSYYVREGRQDADETWGLLTHNWTDWRSPSFVEGGLKPLVRDTLGSLQA